MRIQSLNPTAESLKEFRNFPFINETKIANLAEELPAYLAAADGVTVTCEEDKAAWCAAHADTLPHWSSLVKTLLLIQPSSGAKNLLINVIGTGNILNFISNFSLFRATFKQLLSNFYAF